MQAAEAWLVHGSWVRAHPGVLGADVAARFDWASRVTGSAERAARGVLGAARERLDRILDDRMLLLPSTASTAPRRDSAPADLDRTRSATLALICLAAIGGFPALSAPLQSSRSTEPRSGWAWSGHSSATSRSSIVLWGWLTDSRKSPATSP